MKKIIAAFAAVAVSMTLVSCGTASTVNQAVADSGAKEVTGMTLTAAAGTYTLAEMPSFVKDSVISFKENTLVLKEDGSYILSVSAGDSSESKTGAYTVSGNGTIVLDGGKTSLASKNEKIVCDGEKLTASGALGSQLRVVMTYQKTDK